MKKIGHESIYSFSFFTPRKIFPIMLHMLLISFRFAMCCICYKVYSVWHLFGRLHYIFPIALYVHGNLMFMSFNY